MARSLLKFLTFFSLFVYIFLTSHCHIAFSTSTEDEDDDEDEYVLDTLLTNFRSRSRFLADVIKKGSHCNPLSYNVCDGIWANKGESFLRCCKKHCRNVLRDKNHCGECGHKCQQGEKCCNGGCTDPDTDPNHCGKCGNRCPPGVGCESGSCGYA